MDRKRKPAYKQAMSPISRWPFLKMHGLGNDFVIFDARKRPLALTPSLIQKLADRHEAIGFDQLVLLKPSSKAAARMEIYNADGSRTGACGNASRCVGQYLMREQKISKALIETDAGLLEASLIDPDDRHADFTAFNSASPQIQIDMGLARLAAQDIPLSQNIATDALPFERFAEEFQQTGCFAKPLYAIHAVNMGNPHVIFFMADVAAVPLEKLGPLLERHPLFPERVNVSFAELLPDQDISSRGKGPDNSGNSGSPDNSGNSGSAPPYPPIKLRVFERGAGITRACGTAACATLVAAVRLGICAKDAKILLPGGALYVTQRDDGHVMMTGPAHLSYEGFIAL